MPVFRVRSFFYKLSACKTFALKRNTFLLWFVIGGQGVVVDRMAIYQDPEAIAADIARRDPYNTHDDGAVVHHHDDDDGIDGIPEPAVIAFGVLLAVSNAERMAPVQRPWVAVGGPLSADMAT
jgi:hypothetical protein